jgi:DNA-binding response OmpR family regulator
MRICAAFLAALALLGAAVMSVARDVDDEELIRGLLSLLEANNNTRWPKGNSQEIDAAVINDFRDHPKDRAAVAELPELQRFELLRTHVQVLEYLATHQSITGEQAQLAEAVKRRMAYKLGLTPHHQQWTEVCISQFPRVAAPLRSPPPRAAR